jgi:hypothetical protein
MSGTGTNIWIPFLYLGYLPIPSKNMKMLDKFFHSLHQQDCGTQYTFS